MAHAASGNQVAGLFRQVLGVIAGSFEGPAHGYQVITLADRLPFGIFYMPDDHQIAQAVEFRIVAEHYQGAEEIRGIRVVTPSLISWSRRSSSSSYLRTESRNSSEPVFSPASRASAEALAA